VSAAVAGAIREAVPEGVSLRGLGAWRFRGLPEPVVMFQAQAADLPADFPALRSAVPVEQRT
jgi:class 3 adenylate cyclase